MKVELMYRQGDCYVFSVDEFPDGERKQDKMTKNKQVALGEISGHHHAFAEASAVDLFKLDPFEGLTFVDIKENAQLIHGFIPGWQGRESDNEYHNAIDLKKGKYIIGIVEETDWISKTIRRVVD